MEPTEKYEVIKGVTVQLLQPNILRYEVANGVVISLEAIKELHRYGNSVFPDKPYKVLTVFNKNFAPTVEATDYMASNTRVGKVLVEAFCINSATLKIISNFYFRIKKPVIPAKVFDNERIALNWLLKQ